MRSLLIISVTGLATMLATAAKAQNYPWCAIYKGGGTNCGFTSLERCLAIVSQAGICIQNTTYQPAGGLRPRYRRAGDISRDSARFIAREQFGRHHLFE